MSERAGPGGIGPSEQPLSDDDAAAEKKARPDYGADDGKDTGKSQGGKVGNGTFAHSGGGGTNAQRRGASGSETEADAPGAGTAKKADDLR